MFNSESGYFLIDKPLGWTSFQVVNKLKFLIKYNRGLKIKIGHAGTLDPLATGLLIVCYGKMTKQISGFQDMPKHYTGTIQLGATTPSYDLETDIDKKYPTDHITEDMVVDAAKEMIGKQMQSPPAYSAKNINGKRAYELARKGIKVEPNKNEIEIISFDAQVLDDKKVEFSIQCSKGTYIRTIALDLGKKLKSGGHLINLRRIAIGDYHVKSAQSIDSMERYFISESK